MNSAPMKYCHLSGKESLKLLLPQLTRSAPKIGPSSVARPPTATQITISMDGTTSIEAGEMMPTCGTNSAPANPAIAADRAKVSVLIVTGL